MSTELEVAQQLHQAQLESYRRAYFDWRCDDEMVKELDEDLMRSWENLERAWERAHS